MGCGSSKPQTTSSAPSSSKSAPAGSPQSKGNKFDTDYKRGSTVSWIVSNAVDEGVWLGMVIFGIFIYYL
jgi:hypothetical protein